jgi:hypothetical protein
MNVLQGMTYFVGCERIQTSGIPEPQIAQGSKWVSVDTK